MGETIRFILIFVDCMLCDSDDCGGYGVDEGGVVGRCRHRCVSCGNATLSSSADISGEYQGDLHRL